VSPILVRPVREQLEHDRIIRLLQAKFRRRFEVGINPGTEQNTGVGSLLMYPDLVLMAQGRGHRPQIVIEVETGESVNHLEALAEWAHFARLRPAFHLYVPSGMVEVARRLSGDNHVQINEIWSYHGVGEEIRFTLVQRTREVARTAKVRASAKPQSGTRPKSVPAKRSGIRTKSAQRRKPGSQKKGARRQKRR